MTLHPLRTLESSYRLLNEFGLTPKRLLARLGAANAPKVICTSMPRSGKGLLLNLICMHPALHRHLARTLDEQAANDAGRFTALLKRLGPGEVLASHLRHSDTCETTMDSRGIRHLFISRDPRNAAISTVAFLMHNKGHPLHRLFAAADSLEERIAVAIAGDAAYGYPSAGERLAESAGWLDSAAHIVRFEDLVGDGAATPPDDVRQRVLQGLFGYIGLAVTPMLLHDMAAALATRANRTAGPGRITNWQEEFTGPLRSLFKQVAGRELIRYGYERDDTW